MSATRRASKRLRTNIKMSSRLLPIVIRENAMTNLEEIGRRSKPFAKHQKDRWILALIAAALTSFAGPSRALTCAGSVSYLGLSQTGTVHINVGYGVWYLCSTTSAFNGFTPEGCRANFALILAARAQSQGLAIYFDNSISSCSSIGNWTTPTPGPYHIQVLN